MKLAMICIQKLINLLNGMDLREHRFYCSINSFSHSEKTSKSNCCTHWCNHSNDTRISVLGYSGMCHTFGWRIQNDVLYVLTILFGYNIILLYHKYLSMKFLHLNRREAEGASKPLRSLSKLFEEVNAHKNDPFCMHLMVILPFYASSK
jgi:hypothetical protein